ncbi:unnamed protein product [Ceratitis capitata]|uniref:(Mediterranean fruit fly) hypothetical protein n=1 Tax=Ceratitis capitata TaxID=7213 RepID=A0A811V475_CERCA|nr:unnamed protein product [Ceratitis capitata]
MLVVMTNTIIGTREDVRVMELEEHFSQTASGEKTSKTRFTGTCALLLTTRTSCCGNKRPNSNAGSDVALDAWLYRQLSKLQLLLLQNHHAYRHTENIYDGGTDTDDDECPLESTTMNPYEYETTLDCRDVDTRAGSGGGGGGGGGGSGVGGGTGVIGAAVGGMMSLRHNPTSAHSHQNTLQHQNQQNLQLQQQQMQQQQQSPYDYEYQHLPHRAGELAAAAAAANSSGGMSTAQRNTHGRPGKFWRRMSP